MYLSSLPVLANHNLRIMNPNLPVIGNLPIIFIILNI